MGTFFQGAALVLLALVLSSLLREQGKPMAGLLSMGVCAMVLILAMAYLSPVVDFLAQLEQLAAMQEDMVGILMKVTGISLIGEVAALLCQDSGNAAMGQAVKLLGSFVILWLSIPIFEALLDLVQRILEGL